jgi:3-hydroxybutyryl-CoA dehydrogenase
MPQQIERVAVVGLGTMGHGIAQAFAAGGCQVRGYDHNTETRRRVPERVRNNLREAAAAGLCDPQSIEPTLGRITVAETETDAVEGAQLVIEAVREELSVKQALFARIEQAVTPQTILATNTSSLRVTPMTAHLRHRERVVVAHWFNPPHIVPVVEVVPAETTSDETMEATMGLLRSIGKRPVRLKRDIPGFLVNRVQTAMIREVWSLLSDGVAEAADIDAAIQGSMGFRLAACGPLQIADFGGLDVWASVFQNLAPEIESGTELPGHIEKLVAQGHYGIKTGSGIYNDTPQSVQAKTAERDRRFLALAKLFYS